MIVVSAREFRANQGKVLTAARHGQSVLLTSRYGTFKIVPVTDEDNLTIRTSRNVEDGKIMEAGEQPRNSD